MEISKLPMNNSVEELETSEILVKYHSENSTVRLYLLINIDY